MNYILRDNELYQSYPDAIVKANNLHTMHSFIKSDPNQKRTFRLFILPYR